MTGFTASACANGSLDPSKRVNYALGLVLGEDEFRQEQLYLRERDHRGVRALHGHGTVAGLAVTFAEGQVIVRSGLAVDAAGRFICVSSDQCADLADWIARNRARVLEELAGSPERDRLTIYVVLCYRECETDKVPLPSEPCQSDDESMAASRITDGFELRLQFEPPKPAGELAGPGLEHLLEQLVHVADRLPSLQSPPDEPAALEEIRQLIGDWVERLRPELADRPCLGAPDDPCVLLARLDVDVDRLDDGRVVPAGAPVVDENERPLLLSTRFLQEWLMRLTAVETEEVRVLDDLLDVATAGEADGDVLAFDGALWVPRALPPPVSDHGSLTGLGDDDHPQYLLADGSRALTGDLRAGANRLTDLANAVNLQDAVTLGQLGDVMRGGDGAGGDLAGTYRNPSVVGLRSRPVADADPAQGDVLVWTGDEWRPGQAGAATTGRVLPFAEVSVLGDLRYEVWFNLEAPENPVAVASLNKANLTIWSETEEDPFLVRVAFEVLGNPHRNVFEVAIDRPEAGYGCLRFEFLLPRLRVVAEGAETADQYAARQGIGYEGAGERIRDSGAVVPTVTRFVRDRALEG